MVDPPMPSIILRVFHMLPFSACCMFCMFPHPQFGDSRLLEQKVHSFEDMIVIFHALTLFLCISYPRTGCLLVLGK